MNSLRTARVTVIVLSLGLTVSFIVFFLIAPLVGYPLSITEAQELMNVVVPVFSGYLATAAACVFRKPDTTEPELSPLTMFMLLATAAAFIVLSVVLFWVFAHASKIPSPGVAMTYAMLKGYFLTILSIMTAVYALAIAYLFHAENT